MLSPFAWERIARVDLAVGMVGVTVEHHPGLVARAFGAKPRRVRYTRYEGDPLWRREPGLRPAPDLLQHRLRLAEARERNRAGGR